MLSARATSSIRDRDRAAWAKERAHRVGSVRFPPCAPLPGDSSAASSSSSMCPVGAVSSTKPPLPLSRRLGECPKTAISSVQGERRSSSSDRRSPSRRPTPALPRCRAGSRLGIDAADREGFRLRAAGIDHRRRRKAAGSVVVRYTRWPARASESARCTGEGRLPRRPCPWSAPRRVATRRVQQRVPRGRGEWSRARRLHAAGPEGDRVVATRLPKPAQSPAAPALR